jgi:hypothetical protein
MANTRVRAAPRNAPDRCPSNVRHPEPNGSVKSTLELDRIRPGGLELEPDPPFDQEHRVNLLETPCKLGQGCVSPRGPGLGIAGDEGAVARYLVD